MRTGWYISGPMRGYKHFNFAAFREAEAYLTDHLMLDRVFNPARHDAEVLGMGWEPDENLAISEDMLHEWMRKDLTEVASARSILLLPGWERSEGARREAAVASWCGLHIYQYNPEAPVGARLVVTGSSKWVDVDAVLTGGVDRADTVTDMEDVIEGTTTAQAAFQSHADAIDEFRGAFVVESDVPKDAMYFLNPKHMAYESGEVRSVNPLTGGEKGVKPARFDLLPVGPLTAVATHYGIGARKYEDRNWEKGYEWSKSFAALCRHLWAFWGGEDIDPETGSPHLAAVVFHALAMLEWADTHPELDDRVKPAPPTVREAFGHALR